MEQLTITKEFTWDMAHMLAGHLGLCKNLHGHTYKMHVKVCSKEDSVCERQDMVMDFKDLKEIIKEKIIDSFDHSFAYWKGSGDPVEIQIADALTKNGRKVVPLNFRPTAEKMAIYFHGLLKEDLESKGFEIKNIKLWETPTSYAEYASEGNDD